MSPRAKILTLLRQSGALGRRRLQTHLYVEGGVPAHRVTEALLALEKAGEIRIMLVPVTHTRPRAYKIYFEDQAPKARIRECIEAIDRAHKLLDNDLLKTAGERFVRALALMSPCFSDITQVNRLGKVRLSFGPIVDLTAQIHLDSQTVGALISVKNTYEAFYPKKRLFGQLVASAVSNKLLPILVTGHISREAESSCEDIGVTVFELGRQILPRNPSNWRKLTGIRYHRVYERDILYEAFGPENYEPIDLERPLRVNRNSPETVRDIERFADSKLFETRLKAWHRSLPALQKHSYESLRGTSLHKIIGIVNASRPRRTE